MLLKKTLIFIGISAVMIGLIGCSGKSEGSKTKVENDVEIKIDQEVNLSPENELAEEKVEKPLSGFTPINESELTDEQKSFIDMVSKKAGFYSQGELVVFSLGEKSTGGYSVEFVKQEEDETQVKIFVKLTKPDADGFATQSLTYPYLVGEMNLPAIANVGFYDIETNEEITFK